MSAAVSLQRRVEAGYYRLPAWVGPAVVGVGAAAGCTLLALVDPSQPGRYPVCPFLALTGHYCPGCGSLRGLHRLLRGDPSAAVGFNVLMVLALPYLVWSYLAWALPALGVAAPPRLQPPARAINALLVAVVAFWLLRNLPVAPFAALAP